MKTIVKIGFDHEKIFYKPGKEVGKELATLYPNHIKSVGAGKIVEVEAPVEEAPVVKKSTKKRK